MKSRKATGNSFRAIVSDSKRHVERIREGLISDGIPVAVVESLLGPALDLVRAEPGSYRLPPIAEMLPAAYLSPSGVESTRPIYRVLSQFIHSTPLAVLHLQRDEYHSISAPVFAIAVEAACRGFWNGATTSLAIACDLDAALESAFEELTVALGDVTFEAARWHTLG